MNDFVGCDGCGTQISMGFDMRRPLSYTIDLPGDEDNEYVQHTYTLCAGCKADIVDMLEDKEIDNSRVERVSAMKFVENLRRQSEQLEDIADKLEVGISGVNHD